MTLNSTYNLEGKENVSVHNDSANDFIEPVKPKQMSSSHEFIEQTAKLIEKEVIFLC